jgi:hypothetical protein
MYSLYNVLKYNGVQCYKTLFFVTFDQEASEVTVIEYNNNIQYSKIKQKDKKRDTQHNDVQHNYLYGCNLFNSVVS